MAYSLTWLADVLRNAGCKVVEQPGWKARGRGDMATVRGVLCHHTAARGTKNAPSLGIVMEGRPDLAGPLSQLVLGRDGTYYVVAAGRANHAGAGAWKGITTGNSSFIGIEAENAGDGSEAWSAEIMDAYVRGVAAILAHIGADENMAVGHKEYALPKGRKIDPNFDMVAFRARVAGALAGRQASGDTKPVDAKPDMLRRGDKGDDVRVLQKALGIAIDGDFGAGTERAVKQFQASKGLAADGLVGPASWAALGF